MQHALRTPATAAAAAVAVTAGRQAAESLAVERADQVAPTFWETRASGSLSCTRAHESFWENTRFGFAHACARWRSGALGWRECISARTTRGRHHHF